MEWIGFITLIGLAFACSLFGWVLEIVYKGMSGKWSAGGFALMLLGLLLFWVAWANKPFVI